MKASSISLIMFFLSLIGILAVHLAAIKAVHPEEVRFFGISFFSVAAIMFFNEFINAMHREELKERAEFYELMFGNRAYEGSGHD